MRICRRTCENCGNRQDLQERPTWPGLSETRNGPGTTPYAGHSYRHRTGIKTCRKLLNQAEWTGQNASLGETRPRGRVSPRPGMGLEQRRTPAIPTDIEPVSRRAASFPTRRNGQVRMRVSERLAHVAGSLRDPEWAWNNAVRRPFLQTSNRYRDAPQASQPGGMDRSECESRRDSPTWPGLSETRNGPGTTPYAGHSYRHRTGIETRRKLPNQAEWTGQNASLGETRPRGRVSPRPGMRLEQPCSVSLPSTLTLPHAGDQRLH